MAKQTNKKRKTTLLTQWAGKLVSKPEVRSAGEAEIIYFSIPWNNTNRDGDEYVHWIQARCWSNHPLFPVIRDYCKKGTGVMVSGRLAIERYTNKAGAEVDGFVLHIDTLVLVSNAEDEEPRHGDAYEGDADEGLEQPDTYTPVRGKKAEPVAKPPERQAAKRPPAKRPPVHDEDEPINF